MMFDHENHGESIYPMLYRSSKGEWMRIDDPERMHDFRLVAAYNKLLRVPTQKEADDAAELVEALRAEIIRRRLDPQYKGGRPPRAEVAP